jgi:chemotaxis protein CheX
MPSIQSEKIKRVFSDATILTFSKMTSVDLLLKPADAPDTAVYDLSAVIGFTGDIKGNCVLRLSAETAQEAINRFAGETIESAMEIADGAGELVNMIAGNAKAALQGYSISLSFPEVIRGKGHELGFYRHPSVVAVYYASEIGDITVIVAFSGSTNVTKQATE